MQNVKIIKQKERNKKNTTWFGWRISPGSLGILITGLILLSPILPTTSAEPPGNNDCIFYAYSESQNHKFLIDSNTALFGTNVTVVHNCDYLQVNLNGQFFTASTNSTEIRFSINPGLYNITVDYDNNTKIMNNVDFYPDTLTWYGDFMTWQYGDYDGEYIKASELNTKENYVSMATAIIIWILCVYVYWNLINTYIDRNFCEEVVK